jgi:chromosome segregation ATPase
MARRVVGASSAATRVWANASDESDDAAPLFSDIDSFLRNVKRIRRVMRALGSTIQHLVLVSLSLAALRDRAAELALAIDGWSEKFDLCDSALAQLRADDTSTAAACSGIARLIETHESDLPAIELAIRDQQIAIDGLSKSLQLSRSEAKLQEAEAFELRKALAVAQAERVNVSARYPDRLQSIVDRRDTLQRLVARSAALQDFIEKQLHEVQSIGEMRQTISVLQNVLYAKRAIFLWVGRRDNSVFASERAQLDAEMSQLQGQIRERNDVNRAIKESVHGLRRRSDAIFVRISERSRELLGLIEVQKGLQVEKSRLIVEAAKQKQIEEELVSETQLLQWEYAQLETRRGDLTMCLAATIHANEAGFPDLDSQISAAQHNIRLIEVKIIAYQHKRRRTLTV